MHKAEAINHFLELLFSAGTRQNLRECPARLPMHAECGLDEFHVRLDGILGHIAAVFTIQYLRIA